MKSIFFINLRYYFESKKSSSRTVGWFPTFEEAEQAILFNDCDMFEGSFDYAVIEEHEPGIYSPTISSVWFKAIYDKNFKLSKITQILRIDGPEEFKNITNLTIG